MSSNSLILALLLSAAILPQASRAQQLASSDPSLPNAPSPAQSSSQSPPQPADPSQPTAPQQPAEAAAPNSKLSQDLQRKQTKRILGIIPNFRSVTVDEKLPPIDAHEKFKLGFYDTFDYSDFIYVGILSGISEAENSYPEFHKGAPGYARYYWHSFADTLDGNLMTEFLVPVATHEDPRLYTLGRGNAFKRTGYIVSRLLITRTDSGGRSPNFSEIVGNGAAAGIACLYYPQDERTWTKTGQRWVTQIGLDGFANIVKEFWPDINGKVFHNHD
ncbi:MAG TPA: hypothetical protein VGG85_13645 [Terracidiphilus sp.]|jgi:hypothetical protein